MPTIITICTILFFSLMPIGANCGHNKEKKVLTMGRATEHVVKQQSKIQPIIKYLASRLKDMGIERGEAVLAGDRKYATLRKRVKEGKIDIILESPFKAAGLKRDGIAYPILTLSRRGAGEYNSLIFVRKDSGINTIEDLKGKIIACEDPSSTSSCYLPRAVLRAEGFDMEEITPPNPSASNGKIGYVFAGTELNVSSRVFYKKVAAGALSNLDWSTPGDVPEAYKAKFKVIWESPKIIEFVVLVGAGLDKRLVERIKEEMLMMNKTAEGKKALRAYEFDRFIDSPEKIDKLMTYIERLIKPDEEETD